METLLQEIHSHLSHLEVVILHNTAMRELHGNNRVRTHFQLLLKLPKKANLIFRKFFHLASVSATF